MLVDQWLYFDATAFADQNRVNAFGAGTPGGLDGTNNTNTTFRYSLSPYLRREFAPGLSVLLAIHVC